MLEGYRCKNGIVNKEEFMKMIFNTLLRYPYSDERFIGNTIKANYESVKKAMLDGIVAYIKENPSIDIRTVCRTLKVNSTYIEELVAEGRIEMKPEEVAGLKNELSQEILTESAGNNDRRKLELASMLSNSMSSSSVETSGSPAATFRGYHYKKKN